MQQQKAIANDSAPPPLMFSAVERALALLRASSHIIFITDAEGRPKEDVTLWCEYTGQSLEDIVSGAWVNAFHPADRQHLQARWSELLLKKVSHDIETHLLRSDGVYRLFLIQSSPVYSEDGSIVEWVHIFTDVTEQRELESALRTSEQRFRATFEQAAVGIAHVGLDGRWLLTNEKLCSIVGYSCEELLAMTFQDITYPEDLDADLAYVQRLLNNEITTYTMEKRYICKSGSLVWINLTASLVRKELGDPLFFIAVVEDINARKHIEQEIIKRTVQLEEMNNVLSNFISIVSHEFRTTLTGIQGFSELLSSEIFAEEESREYARDIYQDASRLRRMIDNLLDLERMRQGFMGLNVERLAFNQLLKEVVQRVRLIASTHTLLLHPDPTLPEIEGDRDKLIQVIMNLLTNAVKYAPEGGEITVTSYAEEQGIHLCIEDQGMGIPEDSLEKIFTPYHRVNGARTQYIQGTGLGLPIVRQVAQMHGGWVWAESIVGKGSTFHVTLPLQVPVSSTPIE